MIQVPPRTLTLSMHFRFRCLKKSTPAQPPRATQTEAASGLPPRCGVDQSESGEREIPAPTWALFRLRTGAISPTNIREVGNTARSS